MGGGTGVGGGSLVIISSLTAVSCPDSVFILTQVVGLGERGDPALGLFAGEHL